MFQSFISPNALLIECIIKTSNNATVVSNPFGTQEQLFNRKIVAIETFCELDIAYSPISMSNQVIPVELFNNAFISMYSPAASETSGLIYDQVPLCTMRRVQNQYNNGPAFTPSRNNELFRMKPTEVTWGQKSFITIASVWPTVNTYSALFLIHYLDEGDTGEAWYPNWWPGMKPKNTKETTQTAPKAVH